MATTTAAAAVKTPDYGRRLLPTVIDNAAVTDPDYNVYSITKSDDPVDGFHRISNARYANAVNRVAWLIEEGFGKPVPDTFPSIGYIGPNDLRYAMLTVAAVKVGYTMTFLSPRNSMDGHLAVLDKCECTRWILPSHKLGHVQQILDTRSMTVVPLPEQTTLLGLDGEDTTVPVYPFTKVFDDARQNPFVILHTSGSTGLPKPVRVPHGSLTTIDAQHLLPRIEGRGTHAQFFSERKVAYSTYPNFHSAGMAFCFALPFYYKLSIVLGPALVPVNLDLVNSMFEHGKVDGSLLAPSTLEQIAKHPPSLQRLATTDFTVVGGAPLNKACGDRINEVCRVINIMGVTEGSLFPVVVAERDDWHYHHFHPGGGYEFVQRTDELYEQCQTRDPSLSLFQAFLQTFPDEDCVWTKDMYSKHPTKPGRWLYRGRADDVLVLSNGEKVNPIDMEAVLGSHPDVKAALVVGEGRFQVAAILQLLRPIPTEPGLLQSFWDSLWPYIDQANRDAPAHGQLHRDYILLAADNKPFALAGKDTVLRAVTTKMFAGEVDALYEAQASAATTRGDLPRVDFTNATTIRETLRVLLTRILNFKDTTISDDDDLFVAGLDSLSVIRVVSSLRASLEESGTELLSSVSLGFVYANPTIDKLATAVNQLVRTDQQTTADKSDEDIMQDLLEEFTRDLSIRPRPTSVSHDLSCVILTGSTGSLGSYLLDTLLSNPSVRKVYCLNRSANARERQEAGARTRGLLQDLSSPRVEFLHADLSKPRLGLSDANYNKLLGEATTILHNQWPVHFHLQIASFAPHLRGVRHLVDFAIESPRQPSLCFISSVGVVQAGPTNDPVPETIVNRLQDAEGGYGQSKLVAELVLAKAAETSGVAIRICRLGQIAGPVDTHLGHWKRKEWLPSIVASSKYLNKLPSSLSSLDRVDWLPVNRAADIIVELASSPHEASVFHVVNPQAVPWSTLVPTVATGLGLTGEDIVSWGNWLAALEKSESVGDYNANPGLALLPFYRSMTDAGDAGRLLPVLATTVSQQCSPTLKGMGPVSPTWVAAWLEQWEQ
ncbi:putative NRPS-like protein biosynthetic cluster [Sporothrix eucalyptigena]|uniref:NRPS-like protein biosynthetic cluster n=1 Tax=Sporothrix eucalyptigena TaxID=1812306 RepID=A0ABP0AXH8_9PEZI